MKYLVLLTAILYGTCCQAATWYVREDGGRYGTDATHCDGSSNTAFVSGAGPECAVNHPYEIIGIIGSTTYLQRIGINDTINIASGSYRMGHTPGLYDQNKCLSVWPATCRMASLPSGTKIYGEGWGSGCSSPPELYGVEKSGGIINIYDSSNIELRCLEITDRENCSTNSNLSAEIRCATTYPYGDYATKGIIWHNVDTVLLEHVNIHGISGPGIQGAEITNLTVRDSAISYNGVGGLNGETPGEVDNFYSGTISFINTDISWNGCIEDYPTDGDIVDGSCVGGNASGFGDGLGLTDTQGFWTFDHCTVVGNVEDGLDLLYMRFFDGGSISITNSYFAHNGGNSIKSAGESTIIKDNYIIGDCGYFKAKDITYNVTPCRGNATVWSVLQRPGHTVSIVNNTISGQSDTMVTISGKYLAAGECDGTERAYVSNNIFLGGSHVQTEGKLVDSVFDWDSCVGSEIIGSNNVFYNNKDGINDCTQFPNSFCEDPKVTTFDEVNSTYDFHILAESPAINTGLPSGTTIGQTTVSAVDYYYSSRIGVVDIGMMEYGGDPDPPSCDANHLNLCNSGNCTAAGGNWCTDVCQTLSCEATPTCNDGVLNGDETGVDCGGSCSACPGGSRFAPGAGRLSTGTGMFSW